MNDPSFKRIHWLQGYGLFGTFNLVSNIFCQILQCIFSSFTVILSIKFYSGVCIRVFVDGEVCKSAARIATASGTDMIIANGKDVGIIHQIISGTFRGTLFRAQNDETFDIHAYLQNR